MVSSFIAPERSGWPQSAEAQAEMDEARLDQNEVMIAAWRFMKARSRRPDWNVVDLGDELGRPRWPA